MKSLVTDPFIYLTCSHLTDSQYVQARYWARIWRRSGAMQGPCPGHWVQTNT